MTARILQLVRTEPGPSEETRPTGVVAEAAVFSSGTAVLHWLTRPGATEVYASEADMRRIREFSGRSRFEPPAHVHADDGSAEGCPGCFPGPGAEPLPPRRLPLPFRGCTPGQET